jgi:cysteinyl-tRNA synthetase
MAEAEERWERLQRSYDAAVESCDSVDATAKTEDSDLRAAVDDTHEEFTAAMNDDLNVREAMAALRSLTNAVNRHLDTHTSYDYHGLKRAIETFESLGGEVFGLQFGTETDGDVGLASDLVELLLDVREADREAGNYERADEIRDSLADLGVEVQDSDDGPTFRFE